MIVFFIKETEKFKLLKKIEVNQDTIFINSRIDKINNTNSINLNFSP